MREEALLGQVRVLTDKHDALAAATGQSFNLFKILDCERDEVKTHSAILAELLDPNGSHGQGAVFARLFAERFKIPTDGIESAGVRREVTISDGSRVDILLQTDDMCIVVENKIHAKDRSNQLERYHMHARQWPRFRVIYLTLHGEDPSDGSLGKLDQGDVLCISYEVDVLAWLDDCIKEVVRVPQIREIVAQYQTLLRKLTGQSTGELVMELKDLLREMSGKTYNFEMVPEIANAMKALSIEFEWQFWQTLEKMLTAHGRHPWRLITLDAATLASVPLKEVREDVVRQAHCIRTRSKYKYGRTLRVESDVDAERYRMPDGTEALLRVQVDDAGWGFYGFIAVKETRAGLRQLRRDDDPQLFEHWYNGLAKLEQGWYADDASWLAWTYPVENVPLQKSAWWLEPDTIRRFVE